MAAGCYAYRIDSPGSKASAVLAYDSGNRPMVVSTMREGRFDSATMERTRS